MQYVLKGRRVNSLCEWTQVKNQRVQEAASMDTTVFYEHKPDCSKSVV